MYNANNALTFGREINSHSPTSWLFSAKGTSEGPELYLSLHAAPHQKSMHESKRPFYNAWFSSVFSPHLTCRLIFLPTATHPPVQLLHHLGADNDLLAAVWVPTTPQEDPHGA